MKDCNALLEYYTPAGRSYFVKCGDWHNGQACYCPKCEKELMKQYPQGWRYYAGDVCEHGEYVGGCGIDYMCFDCEMGIPVPTKWQQWFARARESWQRLTAWKVSLTIMTRKWAEPLPYFQFTKALAPRPNPKLVILWWAIGGVQVGAMLTKKA